MRLEENRIKKYMLTFSIVFFLVFNISYNVFSAGEMNLTVTADSNIKQGKSFNVYLNFSSGDGLGAVYAYLKYDDTLLKPGNVSLESKQDNDFFEYSDSDGRIKIILMSESSPKEKIVKIRFSPYNSDVSAYTFYSDIIEAYSADENVLKSTAPASMKLSITENGSITETPEISSHPSDSSISASENSRKIPRKSELSTQDDSDPGFDETASEQASGNEYYVTTRSDPLENNQYNQLALIGAVAAVGVGVGLTIKQYKKLKK